MQRSKGQGHEQPDTPSHAVRITWRDTPPTPAQLATWRWLWARLLGDVTPPQETPQPQDPVSPRAATVATASGGHNLLSEHTNDTTPYALRT